ncbi:hypothetical protein ASE09_17345 [Streptomyces sp. Root66D1]|nr:hypothetical protein ASE09_17345 [Streptomyces sp. Root66D1]
MDGEVSISYGQIYVVSGSGDMPDDLGVAFAGQTSGLCGAAVPGFLWLLTGSSDGRVGFTVEVHDHAPALDSRWEEVVEVSYRPVSAHTELVQWAWEARWGLDLEETGYRVRYCALGMDPQHPVPDREGAAREERYLLQLWPAPPEPDRIVRQSSRRAAYWHGFARALPAPPSADEPVR